MIENAVGWSYNTRYWSFGRKYDDNGDSFGFCPSGNITVGWGANQPNSTVDNKCVQFHIGNQWVSLVNEKCNFSAFFACEVSADI
jgi:hypothetical protein